MRPMVFLLAWADTEVGPRTAGLGAVNSLQYGLTGDLNGHEDTLNYIRPSNGFARLTRESTTRL